MPLPTLDELVTPLTAANVLTQLLAKAEVLGLPVTAWQKLGISRTIYATMAQEFADLSSMINFIAQGGFASYAARMTDANGNEITTWMDLVSWEVYRNLRIPATFAELDAPDFTITNTTAQVYTFGTGEFHFSNGTTGAKFHNSEPLTIAASTTTNVAIVADVAGSGSTSAPGDIDTLDTPLPGVTCSNAATATGTDAETNSSLFLRDIAKLGSLSPNGAPLAYYFAATSILDPTQPFYDPDLTQAITRVKTIAAVGVVNVYVANAQGAPGGGDLTIVNDTIQSWVVPLAVTANVLAATNLSIAITYTAYVPTAAGVLSATVESAVTLALGRLFAALPIGGIVETTANEVPLETIRGTIFRAIANLIPNYAAQISVIVTVPSGDTSVATTEVPVLGAVTASIILT